MRVLITGANRGIGAALSQTLDARGNEVIGTARAAQGCVPLDVTQPNQITALARQLSDAPLDALICNSGVFHDKHERLDDGYPPEMWAQEFAVNVTGVFLMVQAFLPHLRKAPAPKVMIISSQLGSMARATGGEYIYRASKAAALNLGRNLSVDLAPQGIAVGIYHPGWVRTDMGGSDGDLTAEEAASGLADRLAALSLDTSGCFETWDGRTHPD